MIIEKDVSSQKLLASFLLHLIDYVFQDPREESHSKGIIFGDEKVFKQLYRTRI